MPEDLKIAKALLRRKELNEKVNMLKALKNADLYETRSERVRVLEGVDQITAQVPKLDASQVTAEYDFYARQLRLIDGAIQQANWTHSIDGVTVAEVMSDYKAPKD